MVEQYPVVHRANHRLITLLGIGENHSETNFECVIHPIDAKMTANGEELGVQNKF